MFRIDKKDFKGVGGPGIDVVCMVEGIRCEYETTILMRGTTLDLQLYLGWQLWGQLRVSGSHVWI